MPRCFWLFFFQCVFFVIQRASQFFSFFLAAGTPDGPLTTNSTESSSRVVCREWISYYFLSPDVRSSVERERNFVCLSNSSRTAISHSHDRSAQLQRENLSAKEFQNCFHMRHSRKLVVHVTSISSFFFKCLFFFFAVLGCYQTKTKKNIFPSHLKYIHK